MNILSTILVALSLTFDTFAVSVSSAIATPNRKFIGIIKFALVLAIFQGFMPIIGWYAGSRITQYVAGYDKIIAFVLLSGIGIKMIWEALKNDNKDKKVDFDNLLIIIMLAIATSIDALIVGFGFAFVDVNIWQAAMMIGISTFLVSILGTIIGKKASNLIGSKGEIVGGLVLIIIALKFLF